MQAFSSASRFFLVTRTLARTAGAAAATRAIPLFGGIGLVATILFAGNGIDARDVTRSARHLVALRLCLWAAWLIAATPLARSMFSAPGAAFLRSLPIPRLFFLVPLGALLLLLQAPFALLWGRGEGLASGLAAALLAAAAASLIIARPARRWEWIAAAAVAVGIIVGPPAPFVIAAALPGLWMGLGAAWVRAQNGGSRQRRWIFGPSPVALCLAHAARLVRAEVGLGIRGALLAALGGAVSAIFARNRDELDPGAFSALSLLVEAVLLTIAVSGIAGTVQRAEARVRWLLDATGTRGAVRVTAAMSAVALGGALFGLLQVAVSLSVGAPASACLRAAPLLAISGAAMGALASDVVRRVERHPKAGRGEALVGLTLLAIGSLMAPVFFDGLAPLPLLVAAAVLGALSARTAGPPRPRAGQGLDCSGDALAVEGVRKRFGGRWVLDPVSFRWPGPGVLTVRGDNGAGKSTLLEIVAGIAEKDEGAISIGGASLERERLRALGQIGYVPDAMDLPDHLTVEELSALASALKQADRPSEELIERLGVRGFLRDRLSALSLGQRRRACLLAALSGDPLLLILDEPTNGLDAEGIRMLSELLLERTRRGKSALIATHDRAFAEAIEGASVTLAGGMVTSS